MKWHTDVPTEWSRAPDDPPETRTAYQVTMEKRPGGVDGQELREIQTGAFLASDVVATLEDAVDPDPDLDP